jgi:hypothetical protein
LSAETAIHIEDTTKPESGPTVITRSTCPYSGGNTDLSVARFDPDPDEEYAIRFESAYKHYGHGKGRTPVLLGLDMNVERGQIYGLLGKSFFLTEVGFSRTWVQSLIYGHKISYAGMKMLCFHTYIHFINWA